MIIILIILIIKILLKYADYTLIKNAPYKNISYSNNCINYVIREKPMLNEYQKSKWKDIFTYININNKENYIACFQNITFVDYPPFFKAYKKKAKEYPLEQALENNLITFSDLEYFFDNFFSYSDNTQNYKIKNPQKNY